MTEQEETVDLTLINKVPEPTYSIISFPASKLPENFVPLVFSKWLRSLRFGNPLFKRVYTKDYYKNYHTYIENLLKKPDSIIRLAVLTDDQDVVLGFSVSREDVLDYIHVHNDYRRIGIARLLMPKDITTFTHITTTWLSIWPGNPNYKHLQFNPFA